MISQGKVSTNFLSIFLGRGSALFLNFISVVLAARFLGIEKYGLFTAILSTIAILTKFIDIGFGPIVTRENAKNQDKFDLLNTAITLRLILFIILIIFSNIVFQIIKMPHEEILYSNILFLNIILSSRFLSFRDLLEIPFKVRLKMHIVMIANFFDNFLLIVLVLFTPYFENRILYFVIIFCLSNIPGFLILIFSLRAKINYRFKFKLHSANWLVRNSLPLMGYAIFLALFQQLDVVLTKNLISDTANGIYSAGLRLTLPLSVFPVAIVSTILPIVIKKWQKDKQEAITIINLVNKLLLIMSFFSALIISFKSTEIVLLLFGEQYAESAIVINILVWSNIFLFYNFFTVELFTVIEKQKYNFIFSVLIVFIDLISFLLLYRSYSFSGVSIARLVATISGTIFLKFLSGRFFQNYKFININLLSTMLIMLVISLIISGTNLFLFIPIIIITSVIVVLKFNIFNFDEIKIVLNMIDIKNKSPKLYKYLIRKK